MNGWVEGATKNGAKNVFPHSGSTQKEFFMVHTHSSFESIVVAASTSVLQRSK